MSLKFLPSELENIIEDYNKELTHRKNYKHYQKELKKTLKNRDVEYTISWNYDVLEMWCYSDDRVTCLEEYINKSFKITINDFKLLSYHRRFNYNFFMN